MLKNNTTQKSGYFRYFGYLYRGLCIKNGYFLGISWVFKIPKIPKYPLFVYRFLQLFGINQRK